jgi:hypothetical protein
MWQKDNIKVERKRVNQVSEKSKNIRLAVTYKLLKYIKKRKINESGTGFLAWTNIISTNDMPVFKKCIQNNGIYKKIIGNDILIIKDYNNFKEIEKRFTKIVGNSSLKSYTNYIETTTGLNNKIVIINHSKDLIINNDDLNFKGLSGLKKIRNDIYALKHKMVGNTPSVMNEVTSPSGQRLYSISE